MSPQKNVPIIDALPEHYPYRDDGCDVSPSCLGCHLPCCKYDDPTAYYQQIRESRDQEVVQVSRTQGKTVPQLAQHFGLSQRTVHRILQRARAN
ncbi:MAG: hypothetical protein HW388_24 [Dehalococcoidia bacterium]|nr:hypothetical protein [Dehalococcoidia bacterium]